MQAFITVFTLIFLFIFSSVTARGAYAQYFKFQLADPTKTVQNGGSVAVNVMINTNGIPAINGDALITFDPTKISIESAQVTSGNFFTYFAANPLGGSTTKFLISSWEESIAHPKTSTADTLFATLNIKANTCGTTALSFDCTVGNEADSNINGASDSKDVINCASLQPFSLTIACGGPTSTPSATLTPGPTSTPAATATPKPTATPRPTGVPQPTRTPTPTMIRAGAAEVTVAAFGIGTLLTVVGILFIL